MLKTQRRPWTKKHRLNTYKFRLQIIMLKNLKLTSNKRKVDKSQVHNWKIRMLDIPKLAWTKRNVENRQACCEKKQNV